MAAPSSRRSVSGGAALLLAGVAVALLSAGAVRRAVGSAEGFVGGATAPGRKTKVPCKAVDIAMKERIIAVKKTGKITDAMRVVAAARVRRAQDGVEKSRPFSNELQSMIKGLVKKLKGTGLEQELPMLRVPEKVTNVGILIISSNRGLCGAYNSYTFKKTKKRIIELNEQGIAPKVMVVGKKAISALNNRLSDVQLNYTGTFFQMPDTITAKAASEIGDALRNWFLSGEVDKIEIIYGKFLNLLMTQSTIRSVLPLSPLGIENAEDETFKMTTEDGKLGVKKEKAKSAKAKDIENDVIFDQSPASILNSMLPLYLNSQIFSLLYDAQASELSSRMNAMKAATDNAMDLCKRLTVTYNKKRQAAITAEICEISAGALALEVKDDKSGPMLGYGDSEDSVTDEFMSEIESGNLPVTPEEPDGPKNRMEFLR